MFVQPCISLATDDTVRGKKKKTGHLLDPRRSAREEIAPAFFEAKTACYPFRKGAITRLGEWLVRRGLITRAELFAALDAAFRYNCRLGDTLVWMELLPRQRVEEEMGRFSVYRGAPRSAM
jgi:hypothetical protein